MAKCLNCGQKYTQMTVVQKFCCRSCGDRYRRHHKSIYPSITFDCSQCGRRVVTDGIRDKRTRFCCEACEKKYWKHPHWENPANRINFHNMAEYASWERRTNQ